MAAWTRVQFWVYWFQQVLLTLRTIVMHSLTIVMHSLAVGKVLTAQFGLRLPAPPLFAPQPGEGSPQQRLGHAAPPAAGAEPSFPAGVGPVPPAAGIMGSFRRTRSQRSSSRRQNPSRRRRSQSLVSFTLWTNVSNLDMTLRLLFVSSSL